MCGIFLHLSPQRTQIDEHLLDLLQRRGPDHTGIVERSLGESYLLCISTVLHLRGDRVFPQPVSQEHQILQWNGEVFGGNISLDEHQGDTPAVFQLFKEHGVEAGVKQIEGPYAFTWIDGEDIYFARDPLGRRSFLFKHQGDTLSVCSISGGDGWEEVDCNYIYHYQKGKLSLLPRETPKIAISSLPLLSLLSEAVRLRVLLQHPCSHLAILFSGGLDCSLLALLSHQHLPAEVPIDLINVAFAHPRITDYEECPDRQTGRQSLEALRSAHPNRLWNFIAVNVSLEEYQQHKSHIINLMRPRLTTMDLSIGAAFWFASSTPLSKARILLSGLGADELFGGYRRHRRCYFNGGWDAVQQELEKELIDLPYRNLGRDDRCLSDHGREVRHPYLEEHFVRAVQSIPVGDRMNFEQTEMPGDKLLLRRMAMEAGLPSSIASLPKRAIQFGAKSAKIERSHEHGTDDLE